MPQHHPQHKGNLSEISRILGALANEDALQIFMVARNGITKSTKTIKELGLTQKRYYTRLRELMKVGLVEKRDHGYHLTTTGLICYSLGEGLNRALIHCDRLDLADRLKNAKSISLEETQQILQAISRKGLIGPLDLTDMLQPVKLIDNYEQYVTELIEQIDHAQQSICLISSYTDTRVIEALLRALNRGVQFTLLTGDQENLVQKLRMVKMILIPKMARMLLDLIKTRGVKVRRKEVTFNFCLTDDEFAVIELPNPSTKTFYMGFSLQSKAWGQKLKKTFNELYDQGEEDPIVSILRKDLKPNLLPQFKPDDLAKFPYL